MQNNNPTPCSSCLAGFDCGGFKCDSTISARTASTVPVAPSAAVDLNEVMKAGRYGLPVKPMSQPLPQCAVK